MGRGRGREGCSHQLRRGAVGRLKGTHRPHQVDRPDAGSRDDNSVGCALDRRRLGQVLPATVAKGLEEMGQVLERAVLVVRRRVENWAG